MRVTCNNCKSDIILDESTFTGVFQTACTFCFSTFEMKRSPSGDWVAHFSNQEKQYTRTCIQCGIRYNAPSLEGDPVCKNCSQGASPSLNKPLSTFEPFHVRNKMDRPVLKEVFRSKDDEPQEKTSFFKRKITKIKNKLYLLSSRLGTWFVFSVFFALLGWFIFRFFSHPQDLTHHNGFIELQKKLKEQTPNTFRHPENTLERIEEKLHQDQPKTDLQTLKTLSEFIGHSPLNPKAFALLGQVYIRLIRHYPHFAQNLPAYTSIVKLYESTSELKCIGQALHIEILLSEQNTQSALEQSASLVEKCPSDPQAKLTRIHALFSDPKANANTLEHLELFQSQYPDLLESYDLQGHLYERLGKPHLAAQKFEARLGQLEEDAKGLYGLGLLSLEATDMQAAKQWFKETLKVNPGFAEARFALAQILGRTEENLEGSQEQLEKILNLYPDELSPEQKVRAQAELTWVNHRKKNAPIAQKMASQLPPIGPLAQFAVLPKSQVMLNADKSPELTHDLQSFLLEEPDHPTARLFLALSQIKDKQTQNALETLTALTSKFPKWDLPYFYAIELSLNTNKPNEALSMADQLIQNVGATPHLEVQNPLHKDAHDFDLILLKQKLLMSIQKQKKSPALLSAAGLLLYKIGYERADKNAIVQSQSWFNEALALLPSLDYPSLFLGRSASSLGEWIQAQKHFEKTIKANPLNPAAHYYLGITHQKQEHWEEAQAAFEKALSSPVFEARSLNRLGDIAHAQGNKSQAMETWLKAIAADSSFALPKKNVLMNR